MKTRNILIAIGLLFVSAQGISAQGKDEVTWTKLDGVSVPIPPQSHPRLYVRSSHLPELKERMQTPQVKKVLATMQQLCTDHTPEEVAKVAKKDFRYYFEMRGVPSRVQLQALDWCMATGKRHERLLPLCSIRFSKRRSALKWTCLVPVALC